VFRDRERECSLVASKEVVLEVRAHKSIHSFSVNIIQDKVVNKKLVNKCFKNVAKLQILGKKKRK
jgi:hypothetical protein